MKLQVTDKGSISNVVEAINRMLESCKPLLVDIGPLKRTADQNAKLWPMLRDISQQIPWAGAKRSPETWKDLLTAAWHDQLVLPHLYDPNKVVQIGVKTSKLNKKQFSGLVESIYAFGAENHVKWSEPALKFYDEAINGR